MKVMTFNMNAAMKKLSMKNLSASVLLLLAVTCGFTGCGGTKKPDGFPKLIKNSEFTLTQAGVPLAGADVFLTAEEGSGGKGHWSVFGVSDEAGVVHLMTYKDAFKGAPAGTYKITVFKEERTPSQYGDFPPSKGSEIAEWQRNRLTEYRPNFHLVPEQYRSDELTDLEVVISESGAAPNTFDLGPAVREEYIPEGSAPRPGMTVEEVQEEEARNAPE